MADEEKNQNQEKPRSPEDEQSVDKSIEAEPTHLSWEERDGLVELFDNRHDAQEKRTKIRETLESLKDECQKLVGLTHQAKFIETELARIEASSSDIEDSRLEELQEEIQEIEVTLETLRQLAAQDCELDEIVPKIDETFGSDNILTAVAQHNFQTYKEKFNQSFHKFLGAIFYKKENRQLSKQLARQMLEEISQDLVESRIDQTLSERDDQKLPSSSPPYQCC